MSIRSANRPVYVSTPKAVNFTYTVRRSVLWAFVRRVRNACTEDTAGMERMVLFL